MNKLGFALAGLVAVLITGEAPAFRDGLSRPSLGALSLCKPGLDSGVAAKARSLSLDKLPADRCKNREIASALRDI
jgi:hypothetical protein